MSAAPSEPWVARYVRWLLAHRPAVLVALVAATALAAWSARRIELRFAAADFYDYPGNPAVPVLERYYREFGDPGGFVVVLIEAPDVFAPPVLAYVQRLSTALAPDPAFSHIKSLTTANAVYGEDGGVVTGKLMAHLPTTSAETEKVRRVATTSQLLVRRVVAPDSTATAVLAEIAQAGASVEVERAAVASVEAALARNPPPAGVRARVTGAPVVEVEATSLLIADQVKLVPMAIGLILVAAFVLFRTAHGVTLLLAAIAVAVAWSAGIFPLLGRPVDMVCSTVPATLLVYGAVDPIFVLSRFMGKIEAGAARDEAIVETYRELALPCFLTSFTTALGFASFATLPLPTIVTFGKITALGVMFAFATTMTVLPLLLGSLPAPRRQVRPDVSGAERLLTRLAAALRRRGTAVLVVAGLLLVGGAAASLRQTVSFMYVGFLPPGPTVDTIRVLERKLAGVTRTAVELDGPPDSMKRPEVLRAIAAIDAAAEAEPIVTSSVSLADLVMEMNQAFSGGDDPAERRLPRSKTLVAQYLALLDPEDRADFVDDDFGKTHIRVLSADLGSAAWRTLDRAIAGAIARELPGLGVTATVTGFGAAMYPVMDRLVDEMIAGFALGFLIIVLVELVMFRSWRIAVLSIFPNLLAAIACFVLLSVTGTTLRLGTVLFCSVSIGGLFNTTIHFAARVVQRQREGEPDRDAILTHALVKVIPPSLFTAVILSLGFAIFLLSGFPDLRVFGALSMTVLLTGFVSDTIVTPVLFRRFFRWERTAAVPARPVPAATQEAP